MMSNSYCLQKYLCLRILRVLGIGPFRLDQSISLMTILTACSLLSAIVWFMVLGFVDWR
ncbi:unnamed protein product [Moneuplotes crassus]|uniref:Uncharacterized protein n=1 Tax=Euplotes crassus TaxID=5936 RepID=A0AAD1Y3R4_EUPCR|nr:unnamed protein product [Moneuplotes crassus]